VPATGVLDGRAALITGASQGLGLAIARAFLAAGASVYICAREERALGAARDELADLAGAERVGAEPADVREPAAVAALVDAATERFPELSILVNNAGVYGPMGPIETVDWEEWVRAIEINLLAPALLARAMIPHFRRIGRGKIIQLSGGGATSPMAGITAYAASKAGVVRLAESLALELRDDNIDVNALAPGAVNTRMLEEVIDAGPERVGRAYYERAGVQQRSGGTPPERGAELAVWLASPDSDGITGKLISAVWDPWRELPKHRDDLDSDVYTLRRIIPSDRSYAWGDV
jgi:NAD(P)-dependent dehydrogenase (short-subunit alcohol dehydrogenase family)